MSNKELQRQVQEFLYNSIEKNLPVNEERKVKVRLRTIDPRLRLANCDQPLKMVTNTGEIKRMTAVKVSCTGSIPWSIHVTGTIALEKPTVVLKSDLPRSHVLTEDDLTLMMRDTLALRTGYSTDIHQVVGQELKRPLRSGDVIFSYHLQSPDIIKKGDLVTIVARHGGLAVISNGIALNDASQGERIRVENQRSSRIIQAKVSGPNTVEVM